jgi:hypothetical protein
MPTFIDESGDTGPNPDPDNCHFRLTAVWVPSQEVAEAFREDIRRLRRSSGLRADYEFKFSKTWGHPERREAFFRVAMLHEFRFAASSIDKRAGEWPTADRETFFWASAVALAATLRPTYRAAEAAKGGDTPLHELVVVDDNRDKAFLAMIKKEFRALESGCGPGASLVGKVKFRGSGPDELMQLADMVCGAVGAHLDGDSTWYDMIVERDLGITRLP